MASLDLAQLFPPPCVVHRGLHQPLEQSDVEVVRVVDTVSGAEKTFFSKVVDVTALRARVVKPDAKWLVSAASFANEFAFYQHLAGVGCSFCAAVRAGKPWLALSAWKAC